MALCLQHGLVHEGAEVIRGVKHVLRTDVMFSAGRDGARRRAAALRAKWGRQEAGQGEGVPGFPEGPMNSGRVASLMG